MQNDDIVTIVILLYNLYTVISSFLPYLGHKRILRVNNCNEELDNGQFIVQIKSKEAHQRIQIAHLRVGAPTPQVKQIFIIY